MSNRLISAELERSDSARFVALGGYNVGKGYSKFGKVLRWLFYGVILSCVPFLVAAAYEWYIGYNFNVLKVEYLPGFVTITFSVAANACGYATDREKSSECPSFENIKPVFLFLAIVSLCACLLFYSWILGDERRTFPVDMGNSVETSPTYVLESRTDGEANIVSDSESSEAEMSIRTNRAMVIAIIVAGVLTVNIMIGVIIECFSLDTRTPSSAEADKNDTKDDAGKSI